MGSLKKLGINNDSPLLSVLVNEINKNLDPGVTKLDLPVQGTPEETRQSIQSIGKLINRTERYRNAFINAINVIGLVMVNKNVWEDPWEEFTMRGSIDFGDSAVEVSVDIADVFDYNRFANDPTHYLSQVIPNIYSYVHRINYQKYYKVTINETQMAMAFNRENGLNSLVDEVISSLFEGYKYDKYIVNKYMLCRRILDGTITPYQITDFDNKTPRQRATEIKNLSTLMTFRNAKYNPAGLRIATPYRDQIAIMNTLFESELETEVYATSFFRDDAVLRPRLAEIDTYEEHDIARLLMLFDTGDGNEFIPFTDSELTSLRDVLGTIIDSEWFQNYTYSLDYAPEGLGRMGDETKMTSAYNPESLKETLWLHYWGIKSTSPYKQAVVITKSTPAVTNVSVSPNTATISAGQTLQLNAVVTTTGFANKAVLWSVDDTSKADGVTIDYNGLLKVPNNVTVSQVTVTATSIFNQDVTGTATITIADNVVIPSVTSVTVSSAGDVTSVAKGTTLQMSATVEKTGNATTNVTWSVDDESITISENGLLTIPSDTSAESVIVTATSVFDTTKQGTKTLTITAE